MEFALTAPAPGILFSKFVGACTVIIAFDDTITAVDDCAEALDTASVNKLGNGKNFDGNGA